MDATAFLASLTRSLEADSNWIKKDRWQEHHAYRTHAMKGNAVKGREAARDVGVLQSTMKEMKYEWGEGTAATDTSGRIIHRVYGWEWQQVDLVAATAPGPWSKCVWQGRYVIDLALELENNPWEFTLHMRGLLDFNATLRVGVFYTASEDIDEAEVGTGDRLIPLRSWVPPWKFDDWGVYGSQANPLVAVFISDKEPRIVGARRWSPTRPWVEDLWPDSAK